MATLQRDYNIFKILETMKSAWEGIVSTDVSQMTVEEATAWQEAQRVFLFEGVDVRKTFLTEFEAWLFSCEWTTKSVVKEIVGYIRLGTPLARIGALVGLKESAYRMRIQRLTQGINDLVFDGQTCPEGVYSLTDVRAIKRALANLRLVRDPIDIEEEFSRWRLGWIDSHVSQVDSFVVDKSNMDSYFKSVLYLALQSRSFALSMLDGLDPTTLGYAMNDLRSDGANTTKMLFSSLLKHLSSDDVACERAMALAKREYQDYMKRG